MPEAGNDYAGILDEVVAICASVSADNLARRGDSLPATRVNPFALRRLADHIERVLPGAIETERAARTKRIAAARDRRTERQRREAGARAAAQPANVDADPQCPHGCGPLHWSDDQYVCLPPKGCGDEWDPKVIG